MAQWMMKHLPEPLGRIVALFESVSDEEKRGLLLDYAAKADRHAPPAGGVFDVADVRKDAECTDTVGVFLSIADDGGVRFHVSLGSGVLTLTRALSAILCEGFEGAGPEDVLRCPEQCIARIVGAELVRQRSRTILYVLGRMKEVVVVAAALPDGPGRPPIGVGLKQTKDLQSGRPPG